MAKIHVLHNLGDEDGAAALAIELARRPLRNVAPQTLAAVIRDLGVELPPE